MAAFGAMAGPAAVVPRQLGVGQQVQAVAAGALPPPGFAFGAVAQAPKRKKKKKTNGAAGQAQVQQQGQVQAGGQALILGGQQAIPAVVQPAIAPAAPTVAVVQPEAVVAEGTVQVVKKTRAWCWKCASNTHATKDCSVNHFCFICENAKDRKSVV